MTKQEAAIKYITENYLNFNRLRHDVIADKLQVRMNLDQIKDETVELNSREYWRDMTKSDINSIVCHCAQEYDANITSREVITALQSDLIPDVHPLREYILSLRPWTRKVDWIDFVARQVHVKESNPKNMLIQQPEQLDSTTIPLANTASSMENDSTPSCTTLDNTTQSTSALWRICFKKWFVAMVASWMNDDVVNQQVLVLIGKQGIYKTTWLERLIPPHLRSYACKLANSAELNKDERLRIAEFGLIALDEIDSMNNRELNQLKSVITATDVNERAAYAYSKERRVRLASFCASGNRREFLTDMTGNRRWLPFEVESIQNPFFTTLPYELLYAQAWALAQDPTFCYWFELDEIKVMEKHNQEFRDECMEEQWIPILFDVPAEGKGIFLTTAQISERLVSYGNIKRPLPLNQLGRALGDAGFKDVRRKIGNKQRRGWLVYQRDSNEIESIKRLLIHE